jgi:hypothetical protein
MKILKKLKKTIRETEQLFDYLESWKKINPENPGISISSGEKKHGGEKDQGKREKT